MKNVTHTILEKHLHVLTALMRVICRRGARNVKIIVPHTHDPHLPGFGEFYPFLIILKLVLEVGWATAPEFCMHAGRHGRVLFHLETLGGPVVTLVGKSTYEFIRMGFGHFTRHGIDKAENVI